MAKETLFERADRAIAESKRLVDLLHEAMWKAQLLDRNLQDLHWRRLEEEARPRTRINPTLP